MVFVISFQYWVQSTNQQTFVVFWNRRVFIIHLNGDRFSEFSFSQDQNNHLIATVKLKEMTLINSETTKIKRKKTKVIWFELWWISNWSSVFSCCVHKIICVFLLDVKWTRRIFVYFVFVLKKLISIFVFILTSNSLSFEHRLSAFVDWIERACSFIVHQFHTKILTNNKK